MRSLNVSEAKKQFSQIINSLEIVEVRNSTKTVVIMPKEYFLELERQSVILEAQEALEQSNGKKYTSEEVEAMVKGYIAMSDEEDAEELADWEVTVGDGIDEYTTWDQDALES
ncbi:MAG: hypothetical protein HQM12_18260 [SAR324 cluster bacterium]|nr:hypothetical protein [SAR324 cluster bacterium]